jgi:hypothetical protein
VRITSLGAIALCAALFSPSTALAQDPLPPVKHKGKDYDGLSEKRWGKLGTRDFNKTYYVEGRWDRVHGEGIVLYRGLVDTKSFLHIPDGPLKDRLTGKLASNGGKLERKRSLVRVLGVATRGSQGTYLKVSRVDKLPNDEETFLKRLRALKSDPVGIANLAKECAARAKRFDDKVLQQTVGTIIHRELDVRVQALGAADFPLRLRLAARFRKELHDTAAAITLYATVHEATKADSKLRAEALRELHALRAVRVKVKKSHWSWVTYEDFKRAEGFIQRRDLDKVVRWVRRELAELRDAITAEKKRQKGQIDPARTDPYQCAKDARAGKLRRGQTFAEVRRAVGFPKRVFHIPDGGKEKGEWTQWVMPSNARIYFHNGWLVNSKLRTDGWPTK